MLIHKCETESVSISSKVDGNRMVVRIVGGSKVDHHAAKRLAETWARANNPKQTGGWRKTKVLRGGKPVMMTTDWTVSEYGSAHRYSELHLTQWVSQ